VCIDSVMGKPILISLVTNLKKKKKIDLTKPCTPFVIDFGIVKNRYT